MEMVECMGFKHLHTANKSLFLKQFPSSGGACSLQHALLLSSKHVLTLWNGGPLMACPFGLWMNAKLAHLRANFAVRKGPTKEAFSLKF